MIIGFDSGKGETYNTYQCSDDNHYLDGAKSRRGISFSGSQIKINLDII